jgi:hypothetical protein
MAASCSGEPCSIASTEPSIRLRTQPVTPSCLERHRTGGRREARRPAGERAGDSWRRHGTPGHLARCLELVANPCHLEQIETRAELITPNEQRVSMEAGLAKTYRDLASQAAWLACRRWRGTRRPSRIGQGTGPNAVQYRRNAQTSMLDAAGAVPCWIMSHARVDSST